MRDVFAGRGQPQVDLTLESATATSQLTGDEFYTVRGVVQSLAKEASLLKALPSAKALCESFFGPDNSALPSITVAQVASQIANFQSEVAKAQGTLPAAQLELCLTSLNDFKDAIFGSKSSRADPGLARLAELAPLNPFAAPFVASSVIRAAVTNSHIRMCSGVQALLQGFMKRIPEVREVIKALVSRSNDFRGLGGSDPTFQKGDKGNSHRILTPLLVGLLKAPRTRGLLVESVMDHVNEQTKKYWDTIRRSNGDACTDKLVIGSGPNATNFLSMLAELQGGALSGTLNVEASAKAGGTFGCPLQPDMIRALWRLNSRNRPQAFKDFDPAEFLPGGDKALNPFFKGVIQESDLGSDVYSTNESIWQATLLNMFLTAGSAQVSGIYVDVVMRNPRYAPGGVEPTYIVELVNSNEAPPNNRLSMKTNTPILFEGLAQERVADEQINDRQSRLYLEAQRKLPLEQRQVLTGMELQARLGNRSNEWPLRGIKKVIVIGDGDMGRIAAGQLLGIEPQVGLRNNTIDELPKIVWVGQERRTREEFLSRDPSDGKPERPRYAQLANFFPRKGDPGYAYKIEPYSEKFAGIASEVSQDGSVSYRVTLEKGPGAASAPSDDLTIDSSTLVVNCTGFKRDNLRTLRFLNGSRLTRKEAALRSTALIKTPGTTVRYEPNQPQGVSSVEVFEVKKVTDEISDVTLRYEYNNGTIAYERLEVGPQATPTATGIFDSPFVRAVDVPGESPVNTEPLMVKRGDYSFSAGLQVTGEDIYLAGAADQSPPTQGLYDYLDSLKAGVGTRFRAIVEANGDNSVALFFKYLQQLELARHIATLDQGRNPPESLTDSPPLLPSRIQMPVLGRTTNDPLPKQSYSTQDTKATIKEGESPQDTLEYEVARATVFCDFPKTEAYSIELTISRPRNSSGGDALVFEAAAVMRADDSRIPLANCTEWCEWLRSVSSRRAREAVLAMTNDSSQRGTFIKVTIPVDPDSSRKAQLGRLKTEVVRDDRERAALPTGTILEKSQFNAIKEFARNNNLSINDDFCRRLTIIDGRITEANFDGAGLVTLRGLAGITTLKVLDCDRNPQLTSLDGAPQSTRELTASFCGLRDISAVPQLTSLRVLYLTGNRALTSLGKLPSSLEVLSANALDLTGTVTIPAGTKSCELSYNPKLQEIICPNSSIYLRARDCDLRGGSYEQLKKGSLSGNVKLQSSPQHGETCQSDTTYGVSILTTELANLRDFADLNDIALQELVNRIILKDERIVGLDLSEYTLTDLGLLKYFDNLKDLNLSRATGAIDLKNLPCYLETLNLSFTGISSLKLLEDTCPLLKTLKVDETPITTLQGLPLGLQRLSARGTEISGDLRSLSKLALLEVIDISRTKVSSADGLNTTSLQTFVAQLCTELQNSSVQTLKSVPRYDVTGCQKITDKEVRATACVLDPSQLSLLFQDPSLANEVLLPDLRILAKNQYECLKRFVDFNGLAFDKEFCKLLTIKNKEITAAAFSSLGLVTLQALEDITTLTDLDCSRNPRLTSLNGVPRSVTSIRAAFCGLTDISAVGECRLLALDIAGNTTLTSLGELPPDIEYLYAQGCGLAGTVTVPDKIVECDFSYNYGLKEIKGFKSSARLIAKDCDLSGDSYEKWPAGSFSGNRGLQDSAKHGQSCAVDNLEGDTRPIFSSELDGLRKFAEINYLSTDQLLPRIRIEDRRIVGLDLSNLSISFLELRYDLPNLRALKLNKATGPILITSLPTPIESLDLSGTSIDSLKNLSISCPLLKTLIIDDTRIGTLEDLPLGLQKLSARKTKIKGDLAGLSKLALLKAIDVSGTRLSSVEGLQTGYLETFIARSCQLDNSCVNTLQTVPLYDVKNCSLITDSSFKDKSTNLGIDQIKALFQDPLFATSVLLPDLRVLDKTQYECLKGFADANGINIDKDFCERLTIESRIITKANFNNLDLVTLQGLQGITTIEVLRCPFNPRLRTLIGVPRSTQTIEAAYCGLTDISAVSELASLTRLDVCGNRSLTSLGVLPPGIKELVARSCGITGTVTVPDKIVACDFSYNYGLKEIKGPGGTAQLYARDCDLSGDSYEQWPAGSFSGNQGLQDSAKHGQSCAVDNLEGDTRPIFLSELNGLDKFAEINNLSRDLLLPRIRIEDRRIVGLDLSNLSISSLELRYDLPNLRALKLTNPSCEIPISSLPELLESLDVSGTKITSLQGLSTFCPLLKTLIINNTPIDTLEDLPPGLQKLSARGTTLTGDLAGLSKLALLEAIDVSETNISSVEGLNTTSLQAFIAVNCPNLSNNGVETLKKVNLLYNVRGSQITEKPFSGRPSTLSERQVSLLFRDPLFPDPSLATEVLLPDLQVLRKTQYECLERFADANGISIDKDFCKGLTIENEVIVGARVDRLGLVTLKGLEGITSMKYLGCTGNPRLKDLTGVPTSTEGIGAQYCGLTDISAVSELSSLTKLYVDGNRTLTSLGVLPPGIKTLSATACGITGTVTVPDKTEVCCFDDNYGLKEIKGAGRVYSLDARDCDLSGNSYEKWPAGSFSRNRGLQDSVKHGQSCAAEAVGDVGPIFLSELNGLRTFADRYNLSEGDLLPRIRIEDRRIVGLDLSNLKIGSRFIRSLELRKEFPNLRALKLTKASCQIQIPLLPELLESLDLSDTSIDSLKFLSVTCPLLKTLIIDNTTIDTLQNLPPGLQKLSARGTTLTGDLAGLSKLALLEAIDVSETNISSVKGLNTTSLQACIAESCPNLSDNGVETLKNAQLLYNADDSSPITNRTSSDGRSTASSTALYLLFQDPSFQGSSLANEVLLPDLQVLQKTQYECLKRFVDANGLTLDREFCERLVIKGEEITGVKFSYLGLVTLEGLEGITTLTDLDCRGNPRLASLKGAPKSVLRIDGGYCGLTDIGAVSQLDELEQLNVDGCRNLRSLGKLPESIRDISAQACDLTGTVNIPSRTQSGDFSCNPNLRKISGFAEYCNLTARYCDLGGKSYSKLNSENSNFIGNQRLKISNGLEVSVGYNMTLPNDSRPIAATEFKSLEQFANTYEVELQELTQRVQIKDKKIVGLDLSGLSLNNPDLRNFPNVKALNLSNVTGEIDLSTLPTFLETLDVSQTQCDSLEYLYYYCPLLTTLNIDNTNVTSLNGLPLGLQKLSVRGTKLTGDLADLKKLDLLEAIRVSGNGVSSVTGLNTTSLKIFIQEDCPQLDTDLNKEPLASAVEAGRKRLRDDEARDLLFTDPLFATRVLLPNLEVLDKAQYECLKRFADANGLSIDEEFCKRLTISRGRIIYANFNRLGLVTLEGLDGITTIEDLECDSNPRLERLTGIPASTTFLSARWCGLIDISAASVLGPGATLYFGGNRTLQSAAGLPETPKVVDLASCNLTGTFTLSGGYCILDYNPGLTRVTRPEGDEAFKAEVLSAEFCDLTGDLDKQLSATELFSAGNPKLKGKLGKTFNKLSKLPPSKLKLEDGQATCLKNLQKEANLSGEEISKRFTIENGRVVGADLSGISLDQVDLKLLPTLKTLKLSSIRGPLAYLPDCLEELELDSCSIERLENEGEEFLCPLLRTLRLTNTTLREPSLLPAGLKSLTAINSTITEEMGKILLTLELLDTSKVGSLTRCD